MSDGVILLVEDSKKDEVLILRALREIKLSNRIVVVRDGAEALDYLFGEGSQAAGGETGLPTFVLLDLMLPKVGGFEVLRRIRSDARTALLPVVVLTSSDENSDIVASYREGANSYVRKPIKIEEFTQAVADVGLYWTVTNMGPPREGNEH